MKNGVLPKAETYYLLFCDSEESKKAYHLVRNSGIPCQILYSSDAEEKGPILIRDCVEYCGLKEISDKVNAITDYYQKK